MTRTGLRRRAAVLLAALVVLGATLAALAAPLLSYPIRADDAYWVLEVPGDTGSSLLAAFLEPFRNAYDASGQPRITPLAYAERRVVAVGVMFASETLAVEPRVLWGWVKAALAAVIAFALWLFLRVFRFSTPSGGSSALSSRARWIVLVITPIIVTAGIELETYGLSNAWLFYPTLTWLPLAHSLMIASLLIWASRRLGTWPIWGGSAVIALIAGLGVLLALHYELLVVVVPFALLALALQPPSTEGDRRWDRSRIVTALAFFVPYGAVMAANRAVVAQNPCFAEGDCYAGTVIEFDPSVIVANITTSFPGFGLSTVLDPSADGAGLPSLLISIAVAVLAAIATVILLRGAPQPATSDRGTVATDVRGSIILALLLVGLGVATAAVTGVTAAAATVVESMQSPYRTGVVTWVSVSIALALCAVLVDRLTVNALLARRAIAAGALVVVAVTSGAQLWANAQLLRDRVVSTAWAEVDAFHREVALGDVTDRGDARRCAIYDEWAEIYPEPGSTPRRIAIGADAAFRSMHGEPFCSTGVPEGFTG